MRCLALLNIIFLVLVSSAYSADMRVDYNGGGRFLQSNSQYYSSLTCELRFSNSNFRPLMEKYLSRLNGDGDYTSYVNLFNPIYEVFHGVIISKSKPAIDVNNFVSAAGQMPADSVLIPIFYGKRDRSGLGFKLIDSKYWDGFCPEGVFLAGKNEVYVTPVFMYSNIHSGDSFITTLVGAIREVAPKLSLAFMGAVASVEFDENFNEEYSKVADLATFVEKTFKGPSVKVEIKDPIRLRTGTMLVSTELSRFEFQTNRKDSYLLGRGVPFRKESGGLFANMTPQGFGLETSPESIISDCRKFNNTLDEAGLSSPLDRAYVIYRKFFKEGRNKVDVVRCLVAATEKTASAAVLNDREAAIFYHGANKAQQVEDIDIRNYLNEYPEELPENIIPSVLSAKELNAIDANIVSLIDMFDGLSAAPDAASLSANAVARMGEIFSPSLMLENYTSNREALSSLPGWHNELGPFEFIKALANSGKKIDCSIQASNVADSRTKDLVFQGAQFGLVAYSARNIENASDMYLLRLVLREQNNKYRVGTVIVSDSGVKEFLEYARDSCQYLRID